MSDTVRRGPVAFYPKSANRKLSMVEMVDYAPGGRWKRPIPQPPFVCSTRVSIAATCPTTCRFKNNGCYEQVGITTALSRSLDAAAVGMLPDAVSQLEADVIDAQWVDGVPQDGAEGGRDLRLHVGGDVPSEAGARLLAGAAERWAARGGGSIWTYTHRWGEIPIDAWGPKIRVLASCETSEEADEARALGYAVGLTARDHGGERARKLEGSLTGLKSVPCPAQTRSATCASCRLCLDRPLDGKVIAFQVHGRSSSKAKRHLPLDQGLAFRQATEALEAGKRGLADTQEMVKDAMRSMGPFAVGDEED